ncbi:flagellar protein FlhE [Cupriavidus taiwanensis]|uniref:flagellar protein FlhE n=1 Tax=Cupriavidus taiwanensis TaxID=164546 RepID=UPI000E10CFF0|nr:flagellar protein FlhE [Cupriavidus taiwanensis]SOY70296.1 FlhE: flagellar protein [Cupriavidus taiwanensis]SOY70670.1 FlhE: flagellar protein [Cupriavidus taiwanensis]SOY95544.1 FlhE: flagellar protein [Cupriavidus taiwanensis]SOZ74334.1 FlhE: flagellar protein [Cupriavidus taiwanensis]SOZ88285.1 FlhE: flagellar protein [Cupriavidus taiwanensis]
MRGPGRAARGACWLLVAVSACAWAAFDAGTRHAWTGSVNGPALYGRGQRAVSPPILPTGVLPQSEGVITSVRWRYSFAKTPPQELQAYLCNAQRCVLLPQAEGRTDAFLGDDATKGFVFAFRVPGQGSLVPVLQGRSNEVVVGFR